MTARPSSFPEFASVDTFNGPASAINVVEPSTGKKQQGWDWGEKPPREHMNWIHRVSYNWFVYLDEKVTALLTWMSDAQDITKTKTAADADNYFRSQW